MLADQEQQANFRKQAAGRSSVAAAHLGQRIIDRTLLIRLLVLSYDMLVGAAAMAAGVYLRLGEQAWPILSSPEFLTGVAVFMALVGMTGRIVGLNSGLWRYASIADLIAIMKTASLATLGFLAFMFLYSRLEAMPRTSLVTAWALLILLMAGARLTYRVFRNRSLQRRAEGAGSKMAVLIGADGRSEMFIKAVSERPNMAYGVAAVFDDRNRRTGMTMRGVPVIGSLGELEHIVAKCARDGRPLQSIIVTKHRSEMAPGVLDSIIEWGADNGYDLLQAPAQEDMSGHGSEDFELTPLRIEDLLGRPSADLDTQALRDLIGDMTVLVTGAGGSIGGELCRQVVQYAPKRMILVELSEHNLYQIDRSLEAEAPEIARNAILADVRDSAAMSELFAEWRPDLVFHAAALKHVPIVERQPLAGLRTNVIGTRNVADAAREVGVRAMVLISTDKAVNPTNIMGASKRMAERYCQALDLESETRFVTVRFGNVLGSNGSVVPLFEEQIRAGGPVTVTHPDMTRYFMTIPEASQLVLHATR
ncbi:MAG: polysaccharide biosynthesis protein, partial [Pseudomonadota bacterium]